MISSAVILFPARFNQKPLALSLSKGVPRHNPYFDKLSTNGFLFLKDLVAPEDVVNEIGEGAETLGRNAFGIGDRGWDHRLIETQLCRFF